MNILVFKTNIETANEIAIINAFLNCHHHILNCNVDTEDIDNVLRIEASEDLSEHEVILLIVKQGFYCEALPDF